MTIVFSNKAFLAKGDEEEAASHKLQVEVSFNLGEWPNPVSRKTSEDSVKKSFLFEFRFAGGV